MKARQRVLWCPTTHLNGFNVVAGIHERIDAELKNGFLTAFAFKRPNDFGVAFSIPR
jgi:hypothetical protein